MPKFDKRRFFSNLDALKEIVGTRPGLSVVQIVSEIQKRHFPDKSEEEILRLLVHPVLVNRNLFEESEGRYRLTYSNLPEHKMAREILEEKKQLIPSKDLKELIGKRLKQPMKRVFFFPGRDSNFKRIEFGSDGGKTEYWVPSRWRIINDDAFALLQREKSALSEKELE
ncbi:MAG: hypothetical protein ACREDU_11975, partial [Methylocella sp.]